MLPLDIDPKLAWALRNRDRFPLDVQRASREELLRVPGFGTKAADRILVARRHLDPRRRPFAPACSAQQGAAFHHPCRPPAATAGFTVPKAFIDLAATAILHRTPERFGLLYRMLHRRHDDPTLLQIPTDADLASLHALAKAVRRDEHNWNGEHLLFSDGVPKSAAPSEDRIEDI